MEEQQQQQRHSSGSQDYQQQRMHSPSISFESLSLEIIKWKRLESDSSVVVYCIEITKREPEETKWLIECRYSQFDNLDKTLKKVFSNLPELPSKTFFKLKEDNEITMRMHQLQSYVQKLAKRQDIMNSQEAISFFQLNLHAKDMLVTMPTNVGNIDGFVHGVRDFLFERDLNMLFVIGGDMSVVSRLDAYMSNSKWFWEDEDDKKTPEISVGALEIWVKEKHGNHWQYKRQFGKSYALQAICLLWDAENKLIYVGQDEGKLNIIEISTVNNFMKFEDRFTLKPHTKRITGMYNDSEAEAIYTVGEDKLINVIQNSRVTYIVKEENELTNIKGDKFNKRIFVSSKAGQVLVYSTVKVQPEPLAHIVISESKYMRGLYIDTVQGRVFAADFEKGNITVHQGEETQHNQIQQITGKKQPRCLEVNPLRNELYVGYSDGTITVYDILDGQPLCGFKAHSGGLTRLEWLEEDRLLITSAKEKIIKFWKIPDDWRQCESGKQQDIQQYQEKQQQQKSEYQKQQDENQNNTLIKQEEYLQQQQQESKKIDIQKDYEQLDEDEGQIQGGISSHKPSIESYYGEEQNNL